MRTLRLPIIVGMVGTPALLVALTGTVGLHGSGWIAGLAAGWAVTALLTAGYLRAGRPQVTPADWVTLSRALLAAGVTGLVIDSYAYPVSITALVSLASVALALDAVDGQVARRTKRATPLGARFDGEVDAFLIMMLSLMVAQRYGAWVLAIGIARYALLVAGWLLPWLAAPLPFRYWRKVVAAVQGIALTVAISGLLPRTVGIFAVAIALALLTESFGRDVVWLYRTGAGTATRRVLRWIITSIAGLIIWIVLVAPDRLEQLSVLAFTRIPIEGLAVIGLSLVLPGRWRRGVAIGAGTIFGLLTILKILDLAFNEELGRRFNLVYDWRNFGPALGVPRDALGTAWAGVILAAVVLAIALLVALVAWSTVRMSALGPRHRGNTIRVAGVLGAVWLVCAALTLQFVPGVPLASASTADLAVSQARATHAAIQDQHHFETAISADDPYADLPATQLLTKLRGKDVLIVFVESYGQVAVQGSTFSDGVDAVLRQGEDTLAQAGFSSRSAFLDSSTFGGISWLAHSTLQSGLWVNSQQRYDQLVTSDRFTLSQAFGKAGWRTVSDIPSDNRAWPEGTSFYHYDQLYDRRDVGYQGPTFSYASMPDQYSLAAFQRLELTPDHSPVMAEIDLVSSHTPWTPLPSMVPWDQLGDGSIFDPMPGQGLAPEVAWQDRETVRQLYGQSIRYSLQALTSWIARLHDDDLVVIMLGDHQPATTVSGAGANHHVPISIVAHDPAVLEAIDSWNWQEGLLPNPDATVWPMDAFRDRFLDAYGSR